MRPAAAISSAQESSVLNSRDDPSEASQYTRLSPTQDTIASLPRTTAAT
jgi:hypothetical protein